MTTAVVVRDWFVVELLLVLLVFAGVIVGVGCVVMLVVGVVCVVLCCVYLCCSGCRLCLLFFCVSVWCVVRW